MASYYITLTLPRKGLSELSPATPPMTYVILYDYYYFD